MIFWWVENILKCGFRKMSLLINAPLWVEHSSHHFMVGLLLCTHQKVIKDVPTHKGVFIINYYYLKNPHFEVPTKIWISTQKLSLQFDIYNLNWILPPKLENCTNQKRFRQNRWYSQVDYFASWKYLSRFVFLPLHRRNTKTKCY